MECNRDEAVRAKTIAEQKLAEKDYAGAKKFAVKAQTLYPGLDGISQMMTTLDVYISAENKVSGEMDWYGILGVTPSADDEIVKKQYRKLALMLHPDKNKSVGADGAFRLLSDAWRLLSDKAKRLAYNQRRSSKGFQQKVPNRSGPPSAPPRANGFHNSTNKATSNSKTNNNTSRVFPTSIPPRRTDTFWTICHRCKMHYEYLKVYLNHTLLCPNCQESFLASETAPPLNFSKSFNLPSRQHPQSSSNHVYNGNPFGAAKAAYVVHQTNERIKRECGESQAAAGWERSRVSSSVLRGDGPLKKRRGLDDNGYSNGGNMAYQQDSGNGGMRGYGFSSMHSKLNSTRELTPLEIRNMLMEKARMEIHKKMKEWSSETAIKAAAEKEKVKERNKEKEKNTIKSRAEDLNRNDESSGTKRENQAEKCFTTTLADNSGKEDPIPLSMNVPDPDFHDFDLDRTESSFGENQVWAAYDDDDGMPRFYAMIHKVISTKPFEMRISWLSSKTNTEFGPIEWVSSGFSKTCGEFKGRKHEIYKSLNAFSHKVKWMKGTRGIVHIFPRKGDIWALYRNWSPDWNEHTQDELIHKYDMVEVLDDYSEDQGISVTPLIKVAGFRTVFHPHPDPHKVIKIPKEEMFRFSHQVPNYLLTGREAQNAPKGCQELDPAATPLELLHVITIANNVPIMHNGGKVKDELLQNASETKVDEMVDDDEKAKGEEMVVDN